MTELPDIIDEKWGANRNHFQCSGATFNVSYAIIDFTKLSSKGHYKIDRTRPFWENYAPKWVKANENPIAKTEGKSFFTCKQASFYPNFKTSIPVISIDPTNINT